MPPTSSVLWTLVGPSGSGKTTIAYRLSRVLPATVVSQDWFLLPECERPGPDVQHEYNDRALAATVLALLEGQHCSIMAFDLRSRTRRIEIALAPNPITIVEGVTPLLIEEIRRRSVLRIYVNADEQERARRQLDRFHQGLEYVGFSEQEITDKIRRKRRREDPVVESQLPLCQIEIWT